MTHPSPPPRNTANTITNVTRIRLKLVCTLVWTSVFGNLALAQNPTPTPLPSPTPNPALVPAHNAKLAACPSPEQVEPVHLYGLWRAEIEGMPSNITLRFEKNPELSGSVMGVIQRGNVKSQCAGDVDNGVFTLEESNDGKSISATWTGTVGAGSCGKVISGTWNNFTTQTQHKFVLRKATGWD